VTKSGGRAVFLISLARKKSVNHDAYEPFHLNIDFSNRFAHTAPTRIILPERAVSNEVSDWPPGWIRNAEAPFYEGFSIGRAAVLYSGTVQGG
jgi:hypothetical protein